MRPAPEIRDRSRLRCGARTSKGSVVFGFEFGLDRQRLDRKAESPRQVARRAHHPSRPHDRRDRDEHTLDIFERDADIDRGAGVDKVRGRGAPTAASAAMRASINSRASRSQASTDAAVMRARVSRRGVSSAIDGSFHSHARRDWVDQIEFLSFWHDAEVWKAFLSWPFFKPLSVVPVLFTWSRLCRCRCPPEQASRRPRLAWSPGSPASVGCCSRGPAAA